MKLFTFTFVCALSALINTALVSAQDFRKLDERAMQMQSVARTLHWSIIDSCGNIDTRDLQLLSQQVRTDLRDFDEAVMEMRPAPTLERRLVDAERSLENLHSRLQQMNLPKVQYNVNKYGSVGYTTVIGSAPGNSQRIDQLIHELEDVMDVTKRDLRTCQHQHDHILPPPVVPSYPSVVPGQPGTFPSTHYHHGYNNHVTYNKGFNNPAPTKTLDIGGVKLTFGIK